MFDALYFSCRTKLLKAPRAGAVRRAIILLSDGEDNQSHVTREESIDMAQRAEVNRLHHQHEYLGMKARATKCLNASADATGGRASFRSSCADVSNAFAEIQDELRSQYAVSYKPADFKPDGRYRTIEIVASTGRTCTSVRAARILRACR